MTNINIYDNICTKNKQYKINVFLHICIGLEKGGKTWVDTGKGKGCWVQCCQCGNIYHIKEPVPAEKLYITSECERCGNEKALNCGNNKDDIYIYYDQVLDERFYTY